MKAYLDTNVVSSMVGGDNKSESAAISRLLELYELEFVQLVTSEVTRQEIQTVPTQYRPDLESALHVLANVPTVPLDSLLFITSQTTGNVFMNVPVIQNDPVYAKLLALGLKETDAKHVFLAATNGCHAFITCDTGILCRASEIQALLGIVVQLPSDAARGLP